MDLRSERGVVTDFLVKVLVGLVVMGVILFDGGSIVVNAVGLDSLANDMATELSIPPGPNIEISQRDLEKKAEDLAKEHGVRLLKAEIDTEGNIVVKIRRRANTLIVSRIGAIEDWAKATADGQAKVNP